MALNKTSLSEDLIYHQSKEQKHMKTDTRTPVKQTTDDIRIEKVYCFYLCAGWVIWTQIMVAS